MHSCFIVSGETLGCVQRRTAGWCVGGVRWWVSGVRAKKKGNCTYIRANMAEEEVAKLIVGDDSGMCKANFAGDVPRTVSECKER